MKKEFALVCLVSAFFSSQVNAQFFRFNVRPRMSYGQRPQQRRTTTKQYDNFKPFVDVSLGYSYPNLDKQELNNSNYYLGNISQTNYVNASVNYHYNRTSSVGILVTHCKANTSYYSDIYQTSLVANTSLESWAILLNFKRYMPMDSKVVTPYLRTAIGVNIWTQNNTDDSGNKIPTNLLNPSDIAYQISLGVDVNITKNVALFAEAGYGKYIVNGGLAFKF